MEFLRSAKILSILTLASRVLGLFRDMITTYVLPAASADSLYLAWTIPNLFRKLFGEGALSSAFIPAFSRVLPRAGGGAASLLARRVFTFIALCLSALVVFLIGLSYLAPEAWLLPFFSGDRGKMAQTLDLMRILLPYLVIICVIAQCQGVLNVMKEFFIPALSPIILNVAWIVGALLAGYGMITGEVERTLFIAMGIMAGGVLQFLLFGFALKKRGFSLRPSFHIKNPVFREVMATTLPMALGVSAVQVNILIDRGVVYTMVPGDGGVTHLFLGNRLMQFPFALIGLALTTAVFPLLARLSAKGDRKGMKKNLGGALRINFFLSIPAAVGLSLLAHPTISLFFQRGAFTPADTDATAAALLGYVVGIPFLSSVMLLTRAFYAMSHWRRPLLISGFIVAVNIVLDLLLVGPFAEAGVALATSICAVLQSAILFAALRNRIGPMGGMTIFKAILRTFVLTAVLAGAVAGVGWILGPAGEGDSLLGRGGRVFLPLAVGMACYLIPARWICRFEFDSLMEAFKRRRSSSGE